MSPPSVGDAGTRTSLQLLAWDGRNNMVRVVPANTPGAKDARLRLSKCGEAGG